MYKNIAVLLCALCATTASAAPAAENDTVHGHALEGAMHLNEIVVTGVTGQSLLKNTPSAIAVIKAGDLLFSPWDTQKFLGVAVVGDDVV